MWKIVKAAIAILGISLLVGCSAGTASIKTSADKDFEFNDVNKIKPGMREAQVVELLGKPSAFGTDEKGRQYLLYHRTSVSSSAVMAATVVSASSLTKGFEVRIHLKDGVVQSIGYTLYQDVSDKEN
jgi:outer membrane protein assembly factor BamE (lipoprotein component of BamABCDE complex)